MLNWASEASPTLGCSIEISRDILLASERSERDTLRSVQLRIADILLASERSERDTLRSVQLRIVYHIYTRNVLLSAQMGERASVVLICIITSRYNELK